MTLRSQQIHIYRKPGTKTLFVMGWEKLTAAEIIERVDQLPAGKELTPEGAALVAELRAMPRKPNERQNWRKSNGQYDDYLTCDVCGKRKPLSKMYHNDETGGDICESCT